MKQTAVSRDNKRGQLNRQWRSWHKRLGLVSSLFLLLLLFSGVLLNHSHDFALDKTKVKFNWLLDVYGITVPGHRIQFVSTGAPLYITDNILWRDNELLLEAESNLLAAAYRQEMIVAIDAQHLYLLTLDGKLLEKQSQSTGLPTNLSALAVTADDRVWLSSNEQTYLGDNDLLDWQVANDIEIDWLQPEALPEQHTLITLARANHLSWQRVLQDLHSGRIFGRWAVWFWDVVAALMLIMLLLGVRIWWQRK